MAQNNSSILYDVSTCLRDAMDSMFNNGHNIIISNDNDKNFDISNNDELSPTNTLKLMMNKRKLDSPVIINDVEKCQDNGHDYVKRMCTMNDNQQYKQKE
ncbi:unnamed protein product [Rotaria sordida]|uniref:Uncharacterized protein n=1 Tax=Rotaria sordida TaxID=392033 RepID=A0A814RKM3_9BILA|nr:unnamed protein product [Rotaria sordida]CAF1360012.1 unnamed protein product [Rotaria sordida]